MNPKILIHPEEFRCVRCHSTEHPIDRHHIKHHKLFITAFARSIEKRESKSYKKLIARYESFDPRDIALLCRDCHGEIHEEYYYLRVDEEMYNGRKVEYFTWGQAAKLMKTFERYFNKWKNVKPSTK